MVGRMSKAPIDVMVFFRKRNDPQPLHLDDACSHFNYPWLRAPLVRRYMKEPNEQISFLRGCQGAFRRIIHDLVSSSILAFDKVVHASQISLVSSTIDTDPTNHHLTHALSDPLLAAAFGQQEYTGSNYQGHHYKYINIYCDRRYIFFHWLI